MDLVWSGTRQALGLLAGADREIWSILWLSLQVSGIATVISLALGVPAGAALALTRFPGRSVLVNLSGETTAGMVLRQPVALHLNMTTLRQRYPGSLMGTVAYSRQALLDAGRYREEWAAYDKAPRGRKRPRSSCR